jgi:hypothetical protein
MVYPSIVLLVTVKSASLVVKNVQKYAAENRQSCNSIPYGQTEQEVSIFFVRHFNSVVQETKICYYGFSMHPQICGVKSGGVTYGKPGIFK